MRPALSSPLTPASGRAGTSEWGVLQCTVPQQRHKAGACASHCGRPPSRAAEELTRSFHWLMTGSYWRTCNCTVRQGREGTGGWWGAYMAPANAPLQRRQKAHMQRRQAAGQGRAPSCGRTAGPTWFHRPPRRHPRCRAAERNQGAGRAAAISAAASLQRLRAAVLQAAAAGLPACTCTCTDSAAAPCNTPHRHVWRAEAEVHTLQGGPLLQQAACWGCRRRWPGCGRRGGGAWVVRPRDEQPGGTVEVETCREGQALAWQPTAGAAASCSWRVRACADISITHPHHRR